ncbi:MAG: hypothetical protein DHS20C11_13700 [Lysobacteraceae bacterium]|nr:MAG: hypothetical protein DHS20C11_13700 [Xanthomonadaceae bacterium]
MQGARSIQVFQPLQTIYCTICIRVKGCRRPAKWKIEWVKRNPIECLKALDRAKRLDGELLCS